MSSSESLVDLAAIFARAETEGVRSPYHYVPTANVTRIMIALFCISTIAHTGQAVYYRLWWLLPTACLCGIGELLGWSARYWSSQSPSLGTPFMIQISTTIIAPTPLLAANFIILARLITRLGPQYSRLTPKLYTIIFCTCDIIALVVQGAGGGLASSAHTSAGAENGAHIMLGGIIFQLIALIAYAALGTEFFVRYLKNKPVKVTPAAYTESGKPLHDMRGELTDRLRIMFGALVFSTGCLFIRAIYRTIELQDGWNGKIISTEWYFNVFDGTMVILAIYTLNFAHPGVLLSSIPDAEGYAKTPSAEENRDWH